MINVDVENESLSLHGTANHSDFYNSEESNSWWGGETSIRRSIFMGQFIYSFSALGAVVHKIDDMSVQVELNLPGHQLNDYYFEVETYPCNEEDDVDSSGGEDEATGCED